MNADEYDSSYEGSQRQKKRENSLFNKETFIRKGGSSTASLQRPNRKYECGMDEYRKYFSSFNAFDRHKILINQYLLYHPGATAFLKRDVSKDKTDFDVLRENHRFLWEENESIETWGKKIAKKYYDKLFKEYCISDLSRYKDAQVGMRWRTEKEVVEGIGQFVCGEKHCSVRDNLRTWEMNFGYIENGMKKNALVKLRLCHDCSYKLNYKHQRREIKRLKSKKYKGDRTGHRKKSKKHKEKYEDDIDESESDEESKEESGEESKKEELNVWKAPLKIMEAKDEEEEFEEYLQDLFV